MSKVIYGIVSETEKQHQNEQLEEEVSSNTSHVWDVRELMHTCWGDERAQRAEGLLQELRKGL